MKYLIVILARSKSSRLPNKSLIKIQGKEILFRTHERCLYNVNDSQKILVATHHQSIVSYCHENNFNVTITSNQFLNGTDRVCEVAKKKCADTSKLKAYLKINTITSLKEGVHKFATRAKSLS